MKTNNIKIISVLCASLLFTTGLTACSMKDKETVLSTNVNQGVKEEENKIQKTIELGNKYLEEKKYDEAKKTYEKAISININNKQTYLKIKDNYLGKNRLDDAFYIIKLAVDNKVDVLNMKAVLEDIKKKFNVTVIEESVYQNDKVNLPNQVTVKVNNEDTQADVKWNSSSIDTSKAGNFTVEGTAVQYERPVKLVIKVNAAVISDDQVVDLLSKGYDITIHMCDEFIMNPNTPTISIPNCQDLSFMKLPDEFTSKDSIYKYFIRKYGVDKYFTDHYMKGFIDYTIKEYDGKYYVLVGNVGIEQVIKKAKIISKKYTGNTVNVTYNSVYADCDKAITFNATLTYNNGNWLIDKANFVFEVN